MMANSIYLFIAFLSFTSLLWGARVNYFVAICVLAGKFNEWIRLVLLGLILLLPVLFIQPDKLLPNARLHSLDKVGDNFPVGGG